MARMNGGVHGYAVLELNQVAFPRDGRIEAQLPLDANCFGKEGWTKPAGGTFTANVPAEVGMILVVDKAKGVIRTAANADEVSGEKPVMFALNYSTEHLYDEREPQLNKFCMYPSQANYSWLDNAYDDFYPRMGFLAVGDRFTTNCVDMGTYANIAAIETALKAGTAIYAIPATDGYWKLTATAEGAVVAQVVEATTCPNDRDPAVKLMVVKA